MQKLLERRSLKKSIRPCLNQVAEPIGIVELMKDQFAATFELNMQFRDAQHMTSAQSVLTMAFELHIDLAQGVPRISSMTQQISNPEPISIDSRSSTTSSPSSASGSSHWFTWSRARWRFAIS